MTSISECCNLDNCCVVKCFQGSFVRETVLQHLKNILSRNCSPLSDQVKLEGGICEVALLHNAESCGRIFSSLCVNAAFPVLYGPEVMQEMSKENKHFYLIDQASFNKQLLKFLDFINVSFIGVASPYMYVYGKHSKLVWEIEREAVSSINDVPHSSCKLWFVIPAEHVSVFDLMISHFLNLNISDMKFLNLLGHSSPSVEMLEDNFKMNQCSVIFQDCAEKSVLCSPAGCDTGTISAEAVKYVREVRIGNSLSDSICACQATDCHSDNFDHANILSDPQPSANEMEVADIDVEESKLKFEGEETHEQQGDLRGEIGDNVGGNEGEDAYQEIQYCSTSCQPHHKSYNVESKEMCTCVGRQLLQCPACAVTVKAGEDRVQCLLRHVRKCHKNREKSLVSQVRKLYPIRRCPSNLSNRYLDRRVRLASSCSLKLHSGLPRT